MENIRGALKDLAKGINALDGGLNDLLKDLKGSLPKEKLIEVNEVIKEFKPKETMTDLHAKLERLKKVKENLSK